jgi:hypothetical protein
LLRYSTWNLLARLGEKGFESKEAAGAFAILLTLTHSKPADTQPLRGIDASAPKSPGEKAVVLANGVVVEVLQEVQFEHPETRILLKAQEANVKRLDKFVTATQGISPGDTEMMRARFWELSGIRNSVWRFMQSTPEGDSIFSGATFVVRKQDSVGYELDGFRMCGERAWGKTGIVVGKMRNLPVTIYLGAAFDANCPVLVLNDESNTVNVLAFCTDPSYATLLRELDSKLDVAVAAMDKVPFDLAHWQKIAAERYPQRPAKTLFRRPHAVDLSRPPPAGHRFTASGSRPPAGLPLARRV